MKRSRSSNSEEPGSHEHLQAQEVPCLSSLKTPVSPPPRKNKSQTSDAGGPVVPSTVDGSPSLAAIEAGQIEVTDHLEVYSKSLSKYIRNISDTQQLPHLSISEWKDLYSRNEHPQGRHFVIHQHDHPLAGPHYDLRLQFSESSSVSWSVMYGVPGDPNSQRINRNATETRVHPLWSHLNESASSRSGSMIIWDTGEYEVLPYHMTDGIPETDRSQSDNSDHCDYSRETVSESYKLQQAFRNRKIRLRLHGTRLPKGYTVCLRMDKASNFERPIRKGPKRRRRVVPSSRTPARAPSTTDSDSEQSISTSTLRSHVPGAPKDSNNEASTAHQSDQVDGNHSDDYLDFQIRKNNAYPGSSNTIGSIHQRRWFLSLDRVNSGFEATKRSNGTTKKIWTRKEDGAQGLGGFEPFYVRGPTVERSVVTGRLGQDVLDDEGAQDFQPRNGWRPVLR